MSLITVYGGVLDVTNGTLTKTWDIVDLGSLNYSLIVVSQGNLFRTTEISDIKQVAGLLNMKCSAFTVTTPENRTNYTVSKSTGTNLDIIDNDYSDKDAFKTAMNGIMLAYELATPVTLTLTSEQIRAIVGTNNVYSDTNGNTTVRFKDSIQHYIDTKVGS